MSKITFCLFIFVFKLLSMCITGWLFPEITLFSWQQEDNTLINHLYFMCFRTLLYMHYTKAIISIP